MNEYEPICCASKDGLKSTEYISVKRHDIPAMNLSILKANLNGELKLYGDHGKFDEKENGLKVKIASHCCSKWSEIQIDIEIYRILLKGWTTFTKNPKRLFTINLPQPTHLEKDQTLSFANFLTLVAEQQWSESALFFWSLS